MKLPAPLKWFRWLPRFEEIRRPTFVADYVLRKRQEAAARRLGENSIKSLRAELSEAVRIGDRERARELTAKVVALRK